MAFSKQWDSYYKRNNGSQWPWSDLISYFFQVEKHLQENSKVLELGFGTGANIPFFLSKRIDYFGIEGSVSAVNRAKDLFPEFDKRIINGDFSKKINYFDTKFDLIFDRASVAHNNYEGIKKTIKLIDQNLNINGFYIGIDWFGDEHFEFTNGDFIDDIYTKKFKEKDYFGGFGKVHFVNEKLIRKYFSRNFEFIFFEKKIKYNLIDKREMVFYDFILKKNME